MFELDINGDKPDNEIKIKDNVDNNKEILSQFMINKINEHFYQLKDILYVNNNSFYESKNWHPAMAYIDNADVINSILSDRKGE